MEEKKKGVNLAEIFLILAIIIIIVMGFCIVYLQKNQNEQKAKLNEVSKNNNIEEIIDEDEDEEDNKNTNKNLNTMDNNSIIALNNIDDDIIEKCKEYLGCINRYSSTHITFNNVNDLTDEELLNVLYNRINETNLSNVTDKNGSPAYTKEKINELIYEMFGKKVNDFDSNFYTINDNILTPLFADGDPIQVIQGAVYKITDEKITIDYTTNYLISGSIFGSDTEEPQYYEATFLRNGNDIKFMSNKKLSDKDTDRLLVYDIGEEPNSENPLEGNIDIPCINIKNKEAEKINQEIKSKYSEMDVQNEKVINDVSYEAYVNDDVLSLVINEKIYNIDEAQSDENEKIYNINLD